MNRSSDVKMPLNVMCVSFIEKSLEIEMEWWAYNIHIGEYLHIKFGWWSLKRKPNFEFNNDFSIFYCTFYAIVIYSSIWGEVLLFSSVFLLNCTVCSSVTLVPKDDCLQP